MILSSGNYAHRLYTQQLRSAYATGRAIYDPDYATLSDPEIWDRVRRDPVVVAAMELRLSQISGDEWRVMPRKPKKAGDEEKRLASVVEEGLSSLEDFDEARSELAHAILRGSAWAHIDWEERRVSLDRGPVMLWRLPVRLRDIDRFRFELRRVEDVPTWHLFSVTRNAWEPIAPEHWQNLVKVIYRNTEDALGYGRGLLEAIYHFLYFRDELLQKTLSWADRLAFGVLSAQLDQLRDASSGKPNETLVSEWLEVFKKLRANHILIYGEGDNVEVKQGATDGARVVLDLINYFDRAITRLLLAGTLTMGVSQDDAGSLAQSETHRESNLDLVARDKKKLDGALTRDLIGQFLRLNAPQIAAQGLAQVRTPVFCSSSDQEERSEVQATVAATLIQAGVPLRKDELYKKVGYTPPVEGDDVVEARPAQIPGGFGLMPDRGGATMTEVQDTALNGTQIQALSEIVEAVAAKTMPMPSAIELVQTAFPSVDRALALRMLQPAASFVPATSQEG